MTFLMFEVGLLLGLSAARLLDDALAAFTHDRWGRRDPVLAAPLSALINAVGPGLGHLLLGRYATGIYVPAAMFVVLAVAAAPFPLLGLPLGVVLAPLWLAAVLDAAVAARHNQRRASSTNFDFRSR